MSSKMVPKAYPLEKVGHFCELDGVLRIVEYSDLPESMQQLRDGNGDLRFQSGNIAIHLLNPGFVDRLGGSAKGSQLPFHLATKKIPYVDGQGCLRKPEAPNGVKFEMFVFDALPMARAPLVVETLREEDFSPVKNAEGLDSPESCRKDQLKLWAKWFEHSGIKVPKDSGGVPLFDFEVDPLFACDEASMAESIQKRGGGMAIASGSVFG
jgi:UDP-N-acetylglucosamine/UDP-N-acetylgalactosamine diphosphorylase